jgi:hypothetical protein
MSAITQSGTILIPPIVVTGSYWRRKFMSTIYVYVMDTLADWELGYVTAELNSGR